jgi:hypothetical protein
MARPKIRPKKLPIWWPDLLNLIVDLRTRIDWMDARITYLTIREEQHFMAFIDDLEAAVARETTVDDSIVTLLNQIAQALKDAGVDPARQAAVLASLQSNADKISEAVTANTPAA